MNHFRLISIFLSCAIVVFQLTGQNVRIGDDNTTAHPSSILELDGSLGGLEVPELTNAQISTLRTNILTLPIAEISEALGMLVYQTDGKAGLYFFDGNEFVKYNPHGLKGTVGGTYSENYPSFFTFEPVVAADNLGFTTVQLGLGNYQINFDASNYFQNYPIITVTGENQKLALSDELPIVSTVCEAQYIADCFDPWNGNHIEAIRIESFVDLDGPGGNAPETQAMQNGQGFLPPTGVNVADIWPYPTNTAGGTWMGTGATAGIGMAPGLPATTPGLGDYTTQLAGGAWGALSGCSTAGQDPCVDQGNNNFAYYYPIVNPLDVGNYTPCDEIYHPADQSAGQANQLTIRLGKGSGDFFKIFIESTRNWPDQSTVWIDWNRDGDFFDAGESLGWVDQPSFVGQTPNGTWSSPLQLPANTGGIEGPTSSPQAGQFAVPADAELGLTHVRILCEWLETNLWTKPCITSVWGEVENYIVEIYDADVGSTIGVGTDFAYNPVHCAVEDILGSPGNYTGFTVNCQGITGTAADTKVHWDATETTYY